MNLPSEMAVAMQKLLAEKPTHVFDICLELCKVPTINMGAAHFTASGARIVARYDGDPHHEYEILINPIRPK